ncbi:MAG: hypothetical protein V4754_18795 [Pseudomonadota bacterium]
MNFSIKFTPYLLTPIFSSSSVGPLEVHMKDFIKGSPPRTYKTKLGTVIQDDSGFRLTMLNGGKIHLGSDGGIDVDMPIVKRMEIADITQVLSHQINRYHDTVSHVIRFIGGGTFSCVYDSCGKMVEMSSRQLRQKISSDGVLTVLGTFEATDKASDAGP